LKKKIKIMICKISQIVFA